MTTHANYRMQSPKLLKKDVEFSDLVKEDAIEVKVRHIVGISATQLNQCAFCQNTSCLRKTSALLPDRSLCRSTRTTSMNETLRINQQ
jgi:hypothetical protein